MNIVAIFKAGSAINFYANKISGTQFTLTATLSAGNYTGGATYNFAWTATGY